MNREEFKELKDEFALIIYNYEKFIKDCILLDYKYNTRFYDLLTKVRFYEVENTLLARCIQAHVENRDPDIEKIIDDFHKGFKQEMDNSVVKHKIAKTVTEHNAKLNPDEVQAFEKDYVGFIKEHHPVVHALATKEEQEAYEKLKVYYYENNIDGFKKAFEEATPVFKNTEYPEDVFTKISEYYYDIRKRIGQDFTKKQTLYPFVKKEVFADDMSEAREEGELKAQLSKLMADNKKLHADIQKAINYDIKLVEE